MKKRVVLKWLNRLVTIVLMVVLITVSFLVVFNKLTGGEPEVFGYQIKTVLSGSMEPGIQTGSIIAVKPVGEEARNNMKNGDVITFMEDENKLVTHRIIDVVTTESGVIYTTKGDNNNAPDSNAVLADNVVAEYSGLTIPYAGYVINFAQSKNGSLLFLVLPGILLVGYSAFSIWRTLSKLEETKKQNTADEV